MSDTHERRGSNTGRWSDSRGRVAGSLVSTSLGRRYSVFPLRGNRSRVQDHRPAGRLDTRRVRFHYSRRGISR